MNLMKLALFVSSTVINKRFSFAFLSTQQHQRLGFFNSRVPSTTVSIVSLRMSSSISTPALANPPTIPLRNGMQHPVIGFGTYKVGVIPASASSATTGAAAETTTEQRTAREVVADALNVGYRFLECAEFYGNEEQVGQAIADSGIPRNELFLCSKVWTTTIEKGPEAI